MNILKYKELIDTECSNQSDSILNIQAIKVDGTNSLKMLLKCGDLKSCDYLRYKKDKILLIEISDLNFQLANLTRELGSNIPNTTVVSKSTAKLFRPMNIIQKELKEKVTNTILILNELIKYVKFNINKIKIFVVALCTNSTSDIMIFDRVKRDLKKQLKVLIDDIILIPSIELHRIL